MSIFSKLLNVQIELKAPKNQYNQFGKYNYRNCEDILEAVKPLLKKEKLSLVLTDKIINIDGRYYVQATAQLIDIEKNSTLEVTAYAREEETKKGMDGSQITGASSSYARKYALNGLFLIDDTKDSDTTNNHGKDDKNAPEKKLTNKQIQRIFALGQAAGYQKIAIIDQIQKVFGKEPDQLTKEEYDTVCNGYESKAKEVQKINQGKENIVNIGDKVIDKVQLEALENELKRTGVKTIQICKEYAVPALRELKFEQWTEIMLRLEKIPTKPQVNLGL